MTQQITFTAQGKPAPQGSKRAWVNKKTGRAQMSDDEPDRVMIWRQDVKAAALNTMAEHASTWRPFDGPVHVKFVFRFARPAKHRRTGKMAHVLRDDAPLYVIGHHLGDVDKLCRCTNDALTAAGIWADDALVVGMTAIKVYVDEPGQQGATITITGLEDTLSAQVDTIIEQAELFPVQSDQKSCTTGVVSRDSNEPDPTGSRAGNVAASC